MAEPTGPVEFKRLEQSLDRMTRTVRFAWMMVGFVAAAYLILH